MEQSKRAVEPEQRGPGRPLQKGPAPYLRQWMQQHGQRADRVAEAIGLGNQQMYRKLRGAQPFSLTQARAIARFLRVDYAEVFPQDSGVDPRDLAAQRVAEAGPERRLDPFGVRRSDEAANVMAVPLSERQTPSAERPQRRHAS